ncbi:MAG: oxidoreductase [Shimia sp.]|uniref:oxidoreductase n=1 Tax=Shimia sp. TaxID=1954381 RepID=UPI001B2F0878|nr:oxidoreductase [Shimia sp.]MBO6897198.1 oxidoreductase [Shimia sp.]
MNKWSIHFKRLVAVAAAIMSFSMTATAEKLPMPTGEVILTVSGAIGKTNTQAGAEFDLDLLKALEWEEVNTFTSFTDGMQTFEGPRLSSLLDFVSASGTTIGASAINDYFVDIPVTHAENQGVILAVLHNGKAMTVRDKGPIWVIYPQSEDEAKLKRFDNEMIWQLISMEIR